MNENETRIAARNLCIHITFSRLYARIAALIAIDRTEHPTDRGHLIMDEADMFPVVRSALSIENNIPAFEP